ncbi:DUF4434 domain-containing protein [Ideonella sp. B508-1]|uniref:DUF4434 domain-containing protein n=1 Tax=Ideonella sp. B508-1 TaxID=137716 RepID=UPI00034B8140|nr:DUF4434 domain-containing protein [Ideonella sp. B508-1]
MAAATLVASGCASAPPHVDGTFLQPWRSHEALSAEDWRQRLGLMRELGCRELVVQWTGLYGAANDWMLPPALLTLLFDEAARQGVGIRLGLPYDERWWTTLAAPQPGALQAFLDQTRERSLAAMRSDPWSRHAAFLGWYLPYEIDQYNWAAPERRRMLCAWLQTLAAEPTRRGQSRLAVSTFFSRLQTTGSLDGLWAEILDVAPLRPMLQDGVGVAGMGNYAGLEPLRRLLRQRGVAFDLIVELFEQLPPEPGRPEAFRARAATMQRVRAQLAVAHSYGAEHVLAYAFDPWLQGDTPEARQLLQDWRNSL